MPVRAVVFDVSKTLVRDDGTAAPGIPETLARLSDLGITLVAAGNHPQRHLEVQLQRAGLDPDRIVGKDTIGGFNKGSPEWIRHICDTLGLARNALLYVGDTDLDMRTALQHGVVYAHAAWTGSTGQYGLKAPSPQWVAAVVEHIFRQPSRWYWSLIANDERGRPVRAMTLLNANGAGDEGLRIALLRLFKDDIDSTVGPMSLPEFVMLHMLSNVYAADLFGGVDLWTTYPGHTGQPNAIMGDFLDVAAKLFRQQYRPSLLDRHRHTARSVVAFNTGGSEEARRNQLTSMRVNSAERDRIAGKRVLVLDNFLTRGYSTETARNLLLAAGAKEVVVVCVGKYGRRMFVLTAPSAPWDPFSISPPDPASFEDIEHTGRVDPQALDDFIASYRGMARESW